MPAEDSVQDVTSSLNQVHLSRETSKLKKIESEPVDSWEDEASDTETEAEGVSTPSRPATSDLPGAPPPTPSSAARQHEHITSKGSLPAFNFDDGTFETTSPPAKNAIAEDKRPEKSVAVLRRYLAHDLGIKSPPRTAEQRQYEQSIKIMEKKKRDQARDAEQKKKLEAEQAKKAIWDD